MSCCRTTRPRCPDSSRIEPRGLPHDETKSARPTSPVRLRFMQDDRINDLLVPSSRASRRRRRQRAWQRDLEAKRQALIVVGHPPEAAESLFYGAPPTRSPRRDRRSSLRPVYRPMTPDEERAERELIEAAGFGHALLGRPEQPTVILARALYAAVATREVAPRLPRPGRRLPRVTVARRRRSARRHRARRSRAGPARPADDPPPPRRPTHPPAAVAESSDRRFN
jgi:hypothetical protein